MLKVLPHLSKTGDDIVREVRTRDQFVRECVRMCVHVTVLGCGGLSVSVRVESSGIVSKGRNILQMEKIHNTNASPLPNLLFHPGDPAKHYAFNHLDHYNYLTYR